MLIVAEYGSSGVPPVMAHPEVKDLITDNSI